MVEDQQALLEDLDKRIDQKVKEQLEKLKKKRIEKSKTR
jgi:hypothetical protein